MTEDATGPAPPPQPIPTPISRNAQKRAKRTRQEAPAWAQMNTPTSAPQTSQNRRMLRQRGRL